jgi:hypothetical protein
MDQVEDMKIWDSTRIYNFGRISGATDKGIDNSPLIEYPWGPLS